MLHPQTESKLSDWHGGHVVGDVVNLRVQRICKTESRTRPSELNVQKSYSKSSNDVVGSGYDLSMTHVARREARNAQRRL